jgi:glycosyltransferase involved in cell wall biosynthesis
MRICLLCNEYPPGGHGGIGTFTQVIARALAGAGHHVRVVGVYASDCRAEEYEEDSGVEVYRRRRPLQRGRWIAARYALFRTVRAWCRQGEIDLIEAPDYQGWVAAWPRLSVPVVVRLHGSSSYFADEMSDSVRRLEFWLERKAMNRADYCCSVSRYTAERTQEIFGLRTKATEVLYNPVELPDLEVPVIRSRHDIVFTGTLVRKKGIVSLLRSWPLVLKRSPDAKLHVYGKDGRTESGDSMQATLSQELDDHQRATVHFHGHQTRDAVLRALRFARAAVFPSYAEAFAIAPLEAMACGCPTIYSQRGSGSELIDHGRDGLLVDPDSTAGISDSIVRLLTDDELAEQIGAAGQDRIRQRFSLSTALEENTAFYRKCIESYRSGRGDRVQPAETGPPAAADLTNHKALEMDGNDEQLAATRD